MEESPTELKKANEITKQSLSECQRKTVKLIQ